MTGVLMEIIVQIQRIAREDTEERPTNQGDGTQKKPVLPTP